MKRFVIISSNQNNEYLFFLPIVIWAWNKLNWRVAVFMNDDSPASSLVKKEIQHFLPGNLIFDLPKIEGYRSETISQLVRLYAANNVMLEDALLMTSDADMLPLSDYWHPNPNEITGYGRDLSDRHFPICYVAAHTENWKKLMNLTGSIENDITMDLFTNKKAKSENWEEWWQIDQDILTERMNVQTVVRIDRGVASNSHYPLGRIDRGAWKKTLEQIERIDAHLLRPGYTQENWDAIIEIINECLNPTGFDLFKFGHYHRQYIQLV